MAPGFDEGAVTFSGACSTRSGNNGAFRAWKRVSQRQVPFEARHNLDVLGVRHQVESAQIAQTQCPPDAVSRSVSASNVRARSSRTKRSGGAATSCSTVRSPRATCGADRRSRVGVCGMVAMAPTGPGYDLDPVALRRRQCVERARGPAARQAHFVHAQAADAQQHRQADRADAYIELGHP